MVIESIYMSDEEVELLYNNDYTTCKWGSMEYFKEMAFKNLEYQEYRSIWVV